ncbi:MAG TPA: TOBE domain-containing protein, partial [Spirochaetales bacterium]|nr:TOBE domain-containing protein [Spirochaetales bacterium]
EGKPLEARGLGIRSRCVSVEYLGDWVQCRMDCGSQLVDLRFPSGCAPTPGEECVLAPDPESVRVIAE